MELVQQVQAWATAAAAVAAMLTFGALIWYTKETQRLRKATEEQAKNAVMPIIIFGMYSEDPRPGAPLTLGTQNVRNVGCGPAFNIEISPIERAPSEVRFDRVAVLEPKHQYALDYTISESLLTGDRSEMRVYLDSVIEAGQLGEEFEISISYADFAGRRYRSNHLVRHDKASRRVTTAFKSHTEVV